MQSEKMSIIPNIEAFVRNDKIIKSWDLDADVESFIDNVFGILGECIEEKYKADGLEKAQQAMSSIINHAYYFLHGIEHKPLKKIKDKMREDERKIKKQIEDFISILDDNFIDNSPQIQLITLLNDMQKQPYKYARLPKNIPHGQIPKQQLKDWIIMNFSKDFIRSKCVNAAQRLVNKLGDPTP